MNTFLIKNIIISSLMFALVGFLSPSFAQAYFADDAEAMSNTFHIGTLDIEVDESSHSVGISDSGNETFDFNVSNTGTVSTQYQLSATPTACASDFFSGINVEVDQGGTLYTGSLSELSASTTNEGLWEIEVTNDSITAFSGETCEVDLILQGWQEEFADWNTGGFSEEITIELTITANEDMGSYVVPDVVLNEIMPNPNGDDYQDGLDGEWIELYNNTGQAIDLDGWYIEDLAGTEIEIGGMSDSLETTENGTTTIDSSGWLVVYMNISMLDNDDTETVYLYDNNDVLQDEYTYTAGNDTGEYPEDGDTPNNKNGDATTGTSASATEGKTDARIPDGIGEWVDPEPTAGGPNYVTREELEELGYTEGKIDFLLNRQEIARQTREARGVEKRNNDNDSDEASVQVDDSIPDDKNSDTCDEECKKDNDSDEGKQDEKSDTEEVPVDKDVNDDEEQEKTEEEFTDKEAVDGSDTDEDEEEDEEKKEVDEEDSDSGENEQGTGEEELTYEKAGDPVKDELNNSTTDETDDEKEKESEDEGESEEPESSDEPSDQEEDEDKTN